MFKNCSSGKAGGFLYVSPALSENSSQVSGRVFAASMLVPKQELVNQLKMCFGGTGFQPVLAQSKACGYIFPFSNWSNSAISLPDTTPPTPSRWGKKRPWRGDLPLNST
jgi:hypothetical protein